MPTTKTTKKQYRSMNWDDPLAWESDGRLRDGIAVRIPVSLMDATSKEVHDAALRSFNCRHRPGYRVAPRDAVSDFFDGDDRQQAYAEYQARMTSAWRDRPDFRSRQESDRRGRARPARPARGRCLQHRRRRRHLADG